MKRFVRTSLLVLALASLAGLLGAQAKKTIAPDQIPGVAVYIPYPVSIRLDGDLKDWDGIPVQRVSNGRPQGPDPKQNQYFEFSVAADATNLYVYMNSEDSNIITGKHGGDFWNEDSMEFYLNLTSNLNASAYRSGIMQVTINPGNIGNTDLKKLSLSGVNVQASQVQAKVFKTAKGWAFEASVPLPTAARPAHGKAIGFQAHANGASALDRDAKLIWGNLDTDDQSYNNPAVFGRGVFFEVGRTDVPVPTDLGRDMAASFRLEGAKGKTGKTLVWSDEFDYTGAPDPKRWDYDAADVGKYNEELQIYTQSRENSSVANGMLTISARKNSAGQWSSARLLTRGKADWTYGYFEIRAKVPAGRGTWPAIWMMPTRDTYGTWPASGEIDIMEFVGFDPEKVHTSIHTAAFNHRIGTQKTRAGSIAGLTKNFHTYAVEWTPTGLYWYIDDQPFYYFLNDKAGSQSWPFDHPFHIILNVAMGGVWGGMKGVDPALNRADMVVDYVRVYQ